MAHSWYALAWLAAGCIGTAAVWPKPQQASDSKTVAAGDVKSLAEPQVAESPTSEQSLDGVLAQIYGAGNALILKDCGQCAKNGRGC
jgi:hypothetical protein